MEHCVMFFETERLAREEHLEVGMPTEWVKCGQCGRKITVTAGEGDKMAVNCSCGHKMVVVIEGPKRRVA